MTSATEGRWLGRRAPARSLMVPVLIGFLLTWASAGQIIRIAVLHLSSRGSLQTATMLLVMVLGYSLLASLVLSVARRLSDRTAQVAVVFVVVFAAVQFTVFYHFLGPGLADTDEALDILADSLVSHFNPYLRHTALGNTLSPMMGAGLIALPFRLTLGHSAYQNPALFVLGVTGLCLSAGPKVALSAAVLTLSCLGFVSDYSLGGDYYVGGMLACLLAFALLRAIEQETSWRYPLAVLFGMAVTSRASTILVLLLLVAVVSGSGLLRRSILPMSISVVTSLAMWVPWFVAAPRAYAPLQRGHFLGPPLVQVAVFGLIGVILAAACARSRIQLFPNAQPRTVLVICGAGLAVAMLPIAAWSLYSIYRASPFLFFLAPALGPPFLLGVTERTRILPTVRNAQG